MGEGTERVREIEALGILTGARRAGDWSGAGGITGLSVDSRKTLPGHLFAALPGTRMHGAEFIPYAIRMGAAAILTDEAGLALAEAEAPLALPVIVHRDPRLALARAAAAWYGAQPETMVAVTGTNGKTSVASFTRQIWEHLGVRAVNFGTTGVEGALARPLTHTTPEPLTLHRLLAELADEGITHAAMEASSHGLAQRRLDGVRLRAAGFTNITRDHLDYHPTFADYLEAKSGLFTRVLPKDGVAVLNIDDPAGRVLAEQLAARGQRVIRVGADEGADLRILGTRFDATGQDLRFSWQGAAHVVRLGLIGGFQGANALVSAGLAIGCGAEPGDVFAALPALRTVRGRMERAAVRRNGAAIYVDYAHTPDALATALRAMRPHVMGRLIVVFGAGGDRDPGKRPMMGQAARENADLVYVTDDNPRSEDPATIRKAIMEAVPEGNEIGDRAAAILAAVDALQPGDTLLIAGKGHETGQIVGDDVLPFDDAEQASIAVAALEGRLA
ncbi:UDP-N-acetylmuramoyl-L-alanyl-D-glutamate--2,6-diaminopimelate ligase [Halovulum dunhuangense]|uniref:UDP-N-acetylmuramoyl-L-alanyl-D-glutamate--2,6-diaminopimelate ligase n=1 Tax=Halovulum dunhuangense TaxID=1505036 RepID=A0A849L167_9RHOB|nr:UDP-N-acetylmuramoyl-L-alanyl-D-glutamate--2,6-diaminopimelate ligase [Halovulum dunhuangense]NNU80001.1 UDP-N-acetylmuramoyl-L-alanyl-D-glutamate--2,6-diaminopimelate ligase [Halovulum dunhuangense]